MSWGSVSFEATASTPEVTYDPCVFPIRFESVRSILDDLDRMADSVRGAQRRPRPDTVLLSQTQYASVLEFGSRI